MKFKFEEISIVIYSDYYEVVITYASTKLNYRHKKTDRYEKYKYSFLAVLEKTAEYLEMDIIEVLKNIDRVYRS